MQGSWCGRTPRYGELTRELAEEAFVRLRALPILQLEIAGQRERAWEIACRFGFPTVYDSSYLALAQLRGCDFWTADARRFKRVRDEMPGVHLLQDTGDSPTI